MIKTKNLVASIEDIPSHWVMEYYTGCRSLNGQDLMIKSIFNPNDTVPSMSIHYTGENYIFNDFSTGKKGTGVKLVQEIEQCNYFQAAEKVIQDYNNWLINGNGLPITEFKVRAKYKVIDYPKRKWDKTDDNYWGQYELEEKDLARLEAYPLESYTLSNGDNKLKIQGFHIYGYFTKAGDLYKIYQPMIKAKKFLCMKSWTQGLEQLEYKSDTLILTKALKDISCLLKILPMYEYIAPDSENSILKEPLMQKLRGSYKNVYTMMDNDASGRRAEAKYRELYQIEAIPWSYDPELGTEKDPSDAIKRYGSEKVKNTLFLYINSVGAIRV